MTAEARALDRRRRRDRSRKRMAVVKMAFFLITALVICTAASIAAGTERERPRSEAAGPVQTALVVEYEDPRLVDLPEVTAAQAAESTEEAVDLPYTEAEVAALAKTVYGEALVTHSDMEMAAVVWCVLNRVDSPVYSSDSIMEIVTAPRQFHGYKEGHPVDEHIEALVRDVLNRWVREKSGESDVGRVLPPEYLYFWGDGLHNHFTTEFQGGTEWDWSLDNPYES